MRLREFKNRKQINEIAPVVAAVVAGAARVGAAAIRTIGAAAGTLASSGSSSDNSNTTSAVDMGKKLAQVTDDITLEDKEGKNLHLEHIEDLVFLKGASGAKEALQYINSVRDMLEEGGSVGKGLTVKWDGAPAIFTGIDPADGKFFVGTKGVFSQTGKLVKSMEDLDRYGYEGNLRAKLALALQLLSKLGIQGVVQGDMMYTKADLEDGEIDGKESFIFQPNTIAYAVPKDSNLGKRIAQSQMGMIFHTTYTGDNMEDMKASFGVDISGYNKTKDVWFDDATYKDLSGQASLTPEENKQILIGVNDTAKAMKTANFETVNNKEYQELFMQYINARIRRGDTQTTEPDVFVQDFSNWYNGKVQKEISKLKNQDPASPAVKRRTDKINAQNEYVTKNMKGISGALAVYKDIIALKNMLINKLNKVDTIQTLLRTDKGYQVVNPEGFVAIGTENGAVKLVDRMEFSKNNFNAVKNWSK